MVAPRLITRSCCVCQRVELEQRWRYASAQEQADMVLTHTYCPECFHRTLAELQLPEAELRPTALVLACG